MNERESPWYLWDEFFDFNILKISFFILLILKVKKDVRFCAMIPINMANRGKVKKKKKLSGTTNEIYESNYKL